MTHAAFYNDVREALTAAKRREVAAIRDVERIVAEARVVGVPWSVIADGLGVSKQAAQQRYGSS